VATGRPKGAAADYKDDIGGWLPEGEQNKGTRMAPVGAGPASLTVARGLALLGYECVVFDQDPLSGGMMRTQIPKFRLPENVLDEECGYILVLGVTFEGGKRIDSMAALPAWHFDPIFGGCGAPRCPGLDGRCRDEP